MEITQKKTNKENLVFIGTEGGEEYYLNLEDENMGGWSLMGLRPETEDTLRQQARDTEPMDIMGISRQDFNFIARWFDYDAFADDMEDDWLDRHDSQAERENERTGETLYLGFGSGQDIFGYFKKHGITDYESYCAHFEEIGLDKETFDKMNALIKTGDKSKEAFMKILLPQ